MKKPSNPTLSQQDLRDRLIGLGERSVHKSYYPELQKQLQNLREQLELAELVAEIVQELAGEQDLPRALQSCSDALVLRTDAVFVRIWTVDSSGEFLQLQASSGLHTNINGTHSRILIKDFPYKVGKIAREQEPILTNKVVGNPLFHDQDWVAQHGIVAFAGYPLMLEKRLVGVIAFFAQKPLNETFLTTMATIVSQIAVGIERKQAGAELANYRERLEHLVEDRTLKLQEAQAELIQSERLATLGKLTAMVSHELRNPMGTILSAIFSIQDSLELEDVSRLQKALELAERNILRCTEIIDDLTNYARVKKLNLGEQDIDAWVRAFLAEQKIPEEIDCQLQLSSGVRADFDPEKLRQVMVNLVNNAIHALAGNRSQGKFLKVSTCRVNDHYEICVFDNGIGMSSETLEKIFEPLYSTKGFGLGLGMVIVKNIVEQHQGEISIDSVEGHWTRITLRLPVHLENDVSFSEEGQS